MPAQISNVACSNESPTQPNGTVSRDSTVAEKENQKTIVPVFSVWTRLRTRIIASADAAAAQSVETTPAASSLPKAPSPLNSVSFGQAMTQTPSNPTTTALQR